MTQFYTLQISDTGTCEFITWTTQSVGPTSTHLIGSDGTTCEWLNNSGLFITQATKHSAAIAALRHHEKYVIPGDYEKPATYARITRNLETLITQHEPTAPEYIEQFPIE